MNTLIRGDCATAMGLIDTGSVQLILTSPPYDPEKWDGIPRWDFDTVGAESYRILKPGGALVWVMQNRSVHMGEDTQAYEHVVALRKHGFTLYQTLLWQRPVVAGRGSNRHYYRTFDFMFVFSAGPMEVVNLLYDRPTKENTLMRRTDIWKFSTNYEAYGNLLAFPEELAESHILSWSNPGDTVVDQFMGTGTVGVVATRLGRNFIGVELMEDRFAVAQSRIETLA